MEFEGIVFSVLPLVKGTSARGEWMKQDVIFDLPGEFSKKVCVGFWGDKAQDAGALKSGDSVSVSANVESREYNGRWYTEVRGWKMSRKGADVGGAPAGGSSLPPMDAFSDEPAGTKEVDDLPF